MTKKTANVQYQTTGPSKNYIELRAVVTTWCHNIKGLEIREVLCYVEQGGPPQAVKPVIVEQSIQEFCEDERAAVPKKEFRVYTLFSVPGIVLGALRVNINGEDPKDTIEDILAKSAPGDNNGSGTKKDRTS